LRAPLRHLELDRVIAQVRSSIYALGVENERSGIRDDTANLLHDMRSVVGFEVELFFDGPLDTAIDGDVLEHLLATIREALNNIGKHAEATRASVRLEANETRCTLTITDNGVGITTAPVERSGGLGLANLRRRAESLHGTLVIDSAPGGGTVLTWEVPLGGAEGRREAGGRVE
jgi:signal transduction histidine kinase